MRYLILIVLAIPALAQDRIYTATCAASAACTLQQPSSPEKVIEPLSVLINCPTACTAELEHRTTGASGATAITPVVTSPQGVGTSTANVFKNSNVSVGTVVSKVTPSTGSDYVIRFEKGVAMNRTSGNSYTVRPSTSDANITWMWRER
jgi:hypothetical protein